MQAIVANCRISASNCGGKPHDSTDQKFKKGLPSDSAQVQSIKVSLLSQLANCTIDILFYVCSVMLYTQLNVNLF